MATLTGLVGEVIVNLSRNSLHVHDGVTPGGHELGLADASNIQDATASQNGRMTSALVQQINTNAANIAINAGDITDIESSITTLGADKADKIVPSAANNIALLNAGGNLADSGVPFFASSTTVLLMLSALPTGWDFLATNNDRLPLITSTEGNIGNTGGNWTISGLTHAHTHPMPHTHAAGALFVPLRLGRFDDASGANQPWVARVGQGGVAGSNVDLGLGGNTGGVNSPNTAAASTSLVSSNGTWRPLNILAGQARRAA